MLGINRKFTISFSGLSRFFLIGISGAAMVFAGFAPSRAQPVEQSASFTPGSQATYADLVTLADQSALVVRVKIRKQTTLKPERAPGLAPGFVRIYVEAETLALIAGNTNLGESLAYLVDMPLTAKGKAPKLKKREMLIFANVVGTTAKGAAQLQLAGRYAQLNYSPRLEQRLRPILSGLVGSDAPPIIKGVSDALAVKGTLTGESETQVFLETADRSPVSMTILRRPGQPVRWGVSWGEIIDASAQPPRKQTLRWYRLACALPQRLPQRANLARDRAARDLAARDYAYVISQLGPCERALTQANRA